VIAPSARIIRALDHVPGFVAQRLQSGTSTTRLLRPVVNAFLPDREIVVRVRSGPAAGLRLPIHPRSEKYYWTGVHERHVQQALAERLRPGMTFWDVGAHIGFFSLLAARFVTSTGAVEAFEPFPPNRVRLGTSIELNRATNVSVHAVALAADTGSATFHLSSSSLMGSLVPTGCSKSMPVACMRADDVVRTARVPDVIKIDVEGAELAVLRGASRLFTSVKPTVLVELTTDDMVAAVRELVPGYRIQNIGKNHWALEPW
jgi:FkbM family methyltransferase